MNTITRSLAALIVGASVVAGAGVACAAPHTTDGYISEIRAEMDDYESRNMADAQIVSMGQAMCAYPEMLEPASYQTEWTSPAQQENSAKAAEITKRYCDVLPAMPNPMSGTDAGAPVGDPGGLSAPGAAPAPVTAPPTPIALGKPIAINYGGTEDSVTYTVNSVGRCGGSLQLDVTVKTGGVFSTNDALAQTSDYVDTAGVTHSSPSSTPTDYNCYEGSLASAYEMKPGRTYTGHMSFEVPKGTGAALNLYGSDGATRTLDISSK